MYKRLFAFLLSMVITLSFMPAMAFAEDGDDPGMWNGYKWGGYELSAGGTWDAEIMDPRDYYSFEFIPLTTGWYNFKSTGSFDTYGRILDATGDVIYESDFGGDDENFSIDFHAEEESTYYLQACMYDYATVGSFTVELSKTSNPDDDDEDDPGRFGGYKWGDYEINAGDTEEVDIIDPRDYYSYEFNPTVTGWYIFKANGGYDTVGRVLDFFEEDVLAEDDDSGTNGNFYIRFYGEAGETYYLQACMYEYDAAGTFTVNLSRDRINLSGAYVSNIKTKTYTGKAITQAPIVKMNGVTLRNGTDYTLSYMNNVKPGTTAYVTITGKGNYTGGKSYRFTINPLVPSLNLTKVVKGSKSFTAKWLAARAAIQGQFTGYQIQYSTKKSFTGSTTRMKSTTVKRASKVVIRKLKKKKTYYVRIRRYLVWNGQTLYSAWSPAKKVKTK